MARKKNGFDTTMLEKYAERVEAAGGHAALKRATEAAMITAKQEINKKITSKMQQANLPAGGKYSTGDTLDSLDKTMAVDWDGNIAKLPLGFNMDESGITSVLLMHGTPHQAPVKGLKEAVKGQGAMRAMKREQEAALKKILERIGG